MFQVLDSLQLALDEGSCIGSELVEIGQMLVHVVATRANRVLAIAPRVDLVRVHVQASQLHTSAGENLL